MMTVGWTMDGDVTAPGDGKYVMLHTSEGERPLTCKSSTVRLEKGMYMHALSHNFNIGDYMRLLVFVSFCCRITNKIQILLKLLP